jgi:hypothetical protein
MIRALSAGGNGLDNDMWNALGLDGLCISRSLYGASATQSFQIAIAVFPRPVNSRKTRPQKFPVKGSPGARSSPRPGPPQ